MVVAHGGMIAGLVCGLLGLPISTWPSIGGMANCHWAALARRADHPRWRLSGYNVGHDAEPVAVPGARSHPAGARRLAGLPRARARRARRRSPAVAQRRGRRAGRPGRAGGGDRLDGPPRLAGADPRPPDLGDAPAGRRARARRRRHGHPALAAADGAARAAPGRAAGRAAPRGAPGLPAPAAGFGVDVRPHAARRRAGGAAAAPDRPASGAVPCGRPRDPAGHPRGRGPAPGAPCRRVRPRARRTACRGTGDARVGAGARRRAPRPQSARRGARAERTRQPGRHALGLVGARRGRPGVRRVAPLRLG